MGIKVPPPVGIYVYMFKRVDISIVVICYASDVIGYDRRKQELSNAPLLMKQDANSIEK